MRKWDLFLRTERVSLFRKMSNYLFEYDLFAIFLRRGPHHVFSARVSKSHGCGSCSFRLYILLLLTHTHTHTPVKPWHDTKRGNGMGSEYQHMILEMPRKRAWGQKTRDGEGEDEGSHLALSFFLCLTHTHTHTHTHTYSHAHTHGSVPCLSVSPCLTSTCLSTPPTRTIHQRAAAPRDGGRDKGCRVKEGEKKSASERLGSERGTPPSVLLPRRNRINGAAEGKVGLLFATARGSICNRSVSTVSALISFRSQGDWCWQKMLNAPIKWSSNRSPCKSSVTSFFFFQHKIIWCNDQWKLW